MAESYRRTEEKQGSLTDYGKRNNQDTTCGIYLHLPKERQSVKKAAGQNRLEGPSQT